jgi:hypothetical protein
VTGRAADLGNVAKQPSNPGFLSRGAHHEARAQDTASTQRIGGRTLAATNSSKPSRHAIDSDAITSHNCSQKRRRKCEPLEIHFKITWLEGDQGEALLEAQGRALRKALETIAARRRQEAGQGKEKRE